MKKLISILLVLALAATMCGAAFAAGGTTEKTAVSTALKNAKLTKAEITDLEVDYESRGDLYEVEFTRRSNRAEYEYTISAATGEILEKSVEYVYRRTSSAEKIGRLAAQKRVAKFSGIRLERIKTGTCTYSYSGKEGTYEVKFRYKGRLYEYEVQAPTGKIMEYEWRKLN